MSRYSGSGRAAAQAERLARLSEDNAFVDVEAALRRIGVTDAWDSGDVADGMPSGSPSSATGVAGGSGTTPSSSSTGAAAPSASGGSGGGSGGARRLGPALKGTRASQAALLSGARVPLTAALMDQHKAYLESVRTAAKTWAERSSSDSSSEDDNDKESDVSNKSSGDVVLPLTDRRRRAAVPATVGHSKSRPGRPKKAELSSSAATVCAASASNQLVTVTSVQRTPLEGSAPLVPAGKRSRTAAAQAGEEAPAVVASDQSRALARKLSAAILLLRQWKRTVLEAPPELINGVLRPQPHATWAASGTREDAEVLPYPLLQVYTLCPSYEAMTAAPVRRRGAVRQRSAAAAGDEETALTIAVADSDFLVCGPEPKDAHDPQRRAPHRCRRRSRSSRKDGPAAAVRRLDFVESDGGEGAVPGARQHHLCSVCMLPAAYRCVRCRTALFCSITCHVLHDATRCLKFTV